MVVLFSLLSYRPIPPNTPANSPCVYSNKDRSPPRVCSATHRTPTTPVPPPIPPSPPPHCVYSATDRYSHHICPPPVYSATDLYPHHACPTALRLLSYRPLPPPRLHSSPTFTQLKTVTPTTPAQIPCVYSATDLYSHHACPNALRLHSCIPLPHHACPTTLRLFSYRPLPHHACPYVYSATDRYPHHACPTVLHLPSCRELRRYRPTPACH